MISYEDELYHHGIKGMRWGVRRFQNDDGSLTAAGEKRYGSEGADSKKYKRDRSLIKASNNKKNKRQEYLKNYKGVQKHIQKKAFNAGYHKSKGKIIANTILKSAAIAGLAAGAMGLAYAKSESEAGYRAASQAITEVGGLAISGTAAVGITAAIQKGRRKFH